LTFCKIPRVKINNTNIVYKITLWEKSDLIHYIVI